MSPDLFPKELRRVRWHNGAMLYDLTQLGLDAMILLDPAGLLWLLRDQKPIGVRIPTPLRVPAVAAEIVKLVFAPLRDDVLITAARRLTPCPFRDALISELQDRERRTANAVHVHNTTASLAVDEAHACALANGALVNALDELTKGAL